MLKADRIVEMPGLSLATEMEAMAMLPVPPFVELTVALLFFTPAAVPVTLIEKVQELSAGREALLRFTIPVAWVAVIVPPPQLPDNPFGVATTNPEGRLSVKVTPVRSVPIFGLMTMNVRVLVPFNGMEAALKDLIIWGGATTVSGALAVLPVPPLAEVTLPVVFVFAPAVVPVTVTLRVQVPAAAIDPPDRAIVSGATVMSVPPHWLEVEEATVKPAGRVSMNATPFRAVPAFGLVMVKVRVVVPFKGMVAAPKDFMIDGALKTVKDSQSESAVL